jgi:predicted ATPase/class 3 adenylate cyclase
VTFLFTDVEESSRQWEADASAAEALVAAHDKLVRAVVDRHDGYVFTTTGDGFAVAFERATEAVAAAVELQESLNGEDWASTGLRVRMGVHTGEAVERDGDYFGPAVNRSSRIMGLAHGGQILLSAVTAALVPEFETVELGDYQLRGLVRPEQVHQLVKAGLERDFPPLRGDSGTANNLPAELTSFVGRQAEIDTLIVRVSEGRLVTLVGPGGAGKTRLAIEGGRRLLDEFPDGVRLAELAVLRDPAQVASTVANAMGHHDPLAEAGGPGLIEERLAATVGRRRVLLVLDNCEHVLAAAAELVAVLLSNCPRLVVVATSRQSLGVAGERLVEIESLDLPVGDGVAAVTASAAGALFVERAQAVHPRFQLDAPTAAAVAEVCRRLDGLPLAIELAAARSRLLSPVQIADRLEETLALAAPGRSGVERHQTMRAALVWSYDLLSEAEQLLFRRLAVFRSSFILEAAAAVAPEVSGDILSVLGGLVDKSLVTVVDGPAGQRRFRLLEPVRQFAAELLQPSGEQDDAASRHRHHLLSLLQPPPGTAVTREMAAEVDNLRAAVENAMRTSEPEAAIALILAFGSWMDLGLLDEQLERLDAALEAADPARMSVHLLASAFYVASTTATNSGRVDEASVYAGRLAELSDEHPERLDVRGTCAYALGFLTLFRADGDRSQGNRLMREAQEAAEDAGNPIGAGAIAAAMVMAAIPSDAVHDPEVVRAIHDGTRLAQTPGDPSLTVLVRLLDAVLRVMNQESEAYPSCLRAFAELDSFDLGWFAEWGGVYVGVAAELVGDQPVAVTHALRWVRFCRRSGQRNLLTCGIRAAARLTAAAGYHEEAMRLWAGAERVEAATAMRYMALMQRLDGAPRQQCADALGPNATPLLAEGASWSVLEATQAAEEALLTLQAQLPKSQDSPRS